MSGVPRPRNCFLCDMEDFGVRGGRKVWCSRDAKRLYMWDGLHGEVEVYNRRGKHLGVADAISGELIKPAINGRCIDV